MKDVEDVYQKLADRIVKGIVSKLSETDHAKISAMYALWNIRWHWSRQPADDQRLDGAIGVARELSLDAQECLEKTGIASIRPDLTISGRPFTGIRIQQNFWQVRKQMHINKTQYFGPIPPDVYEYRIGGYQVCDKWLKDRKERRLELKDIQTYCRMVTAINSTIVIQEELDTLYPEVEKDLVSISTE